MPEGKRRTKNRLDDFDYCLRKAIAVYSIHAYIIKTQINEEEFAHNLDVHQSDISRWRSLTFTDRDGRRTVTDNSRYAPTFSQILKASSVMGIPIAELLRQSLEMDVQETDHLLGGDFYQRAERIMTEIQKADKKSYRKHWYPPKGEIDLSRIVKLEKSTYVGFFLHLNDEGKHEVNHFIMETCDALVTGAVPVVIRGEGRAVDPYRGNIVSPPAQPFLYIYMRQDTGKVDRGVMIFRFFDGDVQGSFKCGSGLMLSTERNRDVPQIQWVVIIKIHDNKGNFYDETDNEGDALARVRTAQREAEEIDRKNEAFFNSEAIKIIDEITKPVLCEHLPNPTNYYLIFDELENRQRDFHNKQYKKYIEAIVSSHLYCK